ncbi:hypothetical protein D6Z43_13770 [Pseudomonas sp. DY-1]|nr:hypothetical protein D6Z43_13770 [Pseudomonas sp. DY-1]
MPWKSLFEQRMGQQIATTVCGDWVSREVGQQRGPVA